MNQHDELDILCQQEEDEEADWEEYQIQMQIEEFLNPSDWVEYQLALQENPEPPECYARFRQSVDTQIAVIPYPAWDCGDCG
jgi:hypothetical protein